MAANMPEELLPEDGLSRSMQSAIVWHEGLASLIEVGFTRIEAFKLLRSQWIAFWQAAYDSQFNPEPEE